jgi:hypothetical protein
MDDPSCHENGRIPFVPDNAGDAWTGPRDASGNPILRTDAPLRTTTRKENDNE